MARIELIDDDSRPPTPQPSRRPRAQATERTNTVGGSMVSSMKRGMQKESGGGWRVAVLATIALALLVALNWAWLSRIHARVGSIGGWRAAAGNVLEWAQLLVDSPGMKMKTGDARVDGRLRDEV